MGNVGRPRKVMPEQQAINEDEGPVVVKMTLPRELYNKYLEMAEAQDVSASDLMFNRLERCVGHSSIRSLYFHTSHLAKLEELVQKKPIGTPEQALALLAGALSVKVGDFDPIQLSVQQVKRIGMNAFGGRTAETFLADLVKTSVAKAVGI